MFLRTRQLQHDPDIPQKAVYSKGIKGSEQRDTYTPMGAEPPGQDATETLA